MFKQWPRESYMQRQIYRLLFLPRMRTRACSVYITLYPCKSITRQPQSYSTLRDEAGVWLTSEVNFMPYRSLSHIHNSLYALGYSWSRHQAHSPTVVLPLRLITSDVTQAKRPTFTDDHFANYPSKTVRIVACACTLRGKVRPAVTSSMA